MDDFDFLCDGLPEPVRDMKRYSGVTEAFISELGSWPVPDKLTAISFIIKAVASQAGRSTTVIQHATNFILAENGDDLPN